MAGGRPASGDGSLLSERFVYYVLVPAIVIAVLVLGGFAATTVRLDRAIRQTLLDQTATRATEQSNRLDEKVTEQDTIVASQADAIIREVDPDLNLLKKRWLSLAQRLTPTIRAILVIDVTYDTHEVKAFASRSPSPEDDTFRRLLLYQLFDKMELEVATQEPAHLHEIVDGTQYLVSYWQRESAPEPGQSKGRKLLIVAWHDVDRIVKETMPQVYKDPEHGDARMNVVDEQGRIVFGPPIKVGELGISVPFKTLSNWRLQLALASADALSRDARQRWIIQLAMVVIAGMVALFGLVVVIVASARERRLSALKSDFVANVSHELKTPLALIRMFGELLLTGRASSPEKRKQYCEIIVSESERLTALIENVLDFAQVERGKVAYDFVVADVGPIVQRAADVYRYRAEKDGVAIDVEIPSDLPEARIDSRAIELSVMNLLDNALKYAKDGGGVAVSVARQGEEIVIRVADHGPGIPKEEQARIFERFYRGRAASGAQTRGSGIGLALVRHIAESHGGEVVVESPVDADGRGTAFSLHLPTLRLQPLAP